jgi:2-keto-4-pentenoate hydratase
LFVAHAGRAYSSGRHERKARRRIAMAKGEIVTTGTCMTPLDLVAGDQVSADFGVLGAIRAGGD